MPEAKDPHVVAGVLKMFLNDMPDPLLTYELHDCFATAAGRVLQHIVTRKLTVLELQPTRSPK